MPPPHSLDCFQRQEREIYIAFGNGKYMANNFADVPEIFSFHNIYFLIASTIACGADRARGGEVENGRLEKIRNAICQVGENAK